MPASLNEVVELLELEELEVGLFRGHQPRESYLTRVFGGQVAAQSVVAAQATVPEDRHLHSLHVYFLLGGDPAIPIVYDVENVRDGGSFTTRRVAARQHGEIIYYATASFHKREEGWEHQATMPEVPAPDETVKLSALMAEISPESVDEWKREWSGFDLRYIGDNRSIDDPDRIARPSVQRGWMRADGVLPDDQAVHNAAFTYISDFSLLASALLPHGILISSDKVQPASLDHVIWFHRPLKADQWLLYDQFSPSASGARGLATANVFTESGVLVASVAQEGLIRPTQKLS